MAIKTQTQIDEMMALPRDQRPAGWAWWATQEMLDAQVAGKAAEEAATAARKAKREAAIAAENATHNYTKKQPGYCQKCHSYCYGDCSAA